MDTFQINEKEEIIIDIEHNVGGKREIKPDFYMEKKAVFDAKYKNAWSKLGNETTWNGGVIRNDVFQVFAYMLALDVKIGGVVFPVSNTVRKYRMSKIKSENYFYTIPYAVDVEAENYVDFEQKMDAQNQRIIERLTGYLKS